MDLVQQVEAAISERQPEKIGGGETRFLCVAHDDHRPSARWSPGKATWHCDVCGAGGGYVDLAKRLGLNLNGHGTTKPKGKGKIIDTYAYVDEAGDLLFQVVRFEPKDFRQRKPDGQGGWVWSLKGTRRVLYNLPEVLKAVKEKRFALLVEGERDADNLMRLGFTATTAPQGAGKWQKTYSDTLKGARVALLPDQDEAGANHRDTVLAELAGVAAEVRVVDVPSGKDVSDWLAAGGTADELKRLVQAAKPVEPEQQTGPLAELERLREENKRLKGQMLVAEDATRAQILEALSEQLGLGITAVIKYASDESSYELEVESKRVQVGGIEKFMEQRPLRHRIADVCGKLMRGFSKEAWDNVTDLMLRAVEVRTVDEASGKDTLARWLGGYLASFSTSKNGATPWENLAIVGQPFVKDGRTYINLEELKRYLSARNGESVAIPQIAELMTKHGGSSERLRGKTVNTTVTRTFQRRFWHVPDAFIDSDDEPEEPREKAIF